MQRILCNFDYFVEKLLFFCKSSLISKTLKLCDYLGIFFIVSLDVGSYFDIVTLGI